MNRIQKPGAVLAAVFAVMTIGVALPAFAGDHDRGSASHHYNIYTHRKAVHKGWYKAKKLKARRHRHTIWSEDWPGRGRSHNPPWSNARWKR